MGIRKIVKENVKKSPLLHAIVQNRFTDFHHWDLNRFIREEATKILPGSTVIDIGAGELRYKHHFSHCKYKSNDLAVGDSNWDYSNIDILSSAYNIPVEDNSFDAVMLTQVLEHLEYPDQAFNEIGRILKPGGVLILTAPLSFEEHQVPHDFFRYTRYGLKSLGARNNLTLSRIMPQGGVFTNLETCFWCSVWTILPIKRHSTIRYLLSVLFLPFKFLTGLLAYCLDALDKNKSFTINYKANYINTKKIPLN